MTANHRNTRQVYALGETVLDMVSSDGIAFRAVPGGSMLNASVSLGRMAADVQFISEFGADIAGNNIAGFLNRNAVKTDFCIRYPQNNTSLALAYLDQAKNASYTFYHDSPENLPETTIPVFQKEDILLFGSFYSVKPGRRNFVLKVLQKAVEARSVIYYDLNIRKAHAGDMDSLMPAFLNNISVATVVKGSDEDFFHLFGISDPEAVYEKISRYCKVLIYTGGTKPLHIFTPAFSKKYSVPEITPVSTIGAGDNFNAGFLYGLAISEFDAKQLPEIPVSEMDKLAGCGLAFATETCLSAENYIVGSFTPDFWKRYI